MRTESEATDSLSRYLTYLAPFVVVGGLTLASAGWAVRAFSDVPRGLPGRNAEAEQAARAARKSGASSVGLPAVPNDELLNRASAAFNRIAQTAMPAVVSINTIRKAGAPGMGAPGDDTEAPMLPPGHPFSRRRMPGFGAPGGPGMGDPSARNPRMMGIGSGILIRSDGHVLTNHHVIEEAERITVVFDEKHRSQAHVVGDDPKTDLAVLKIDGPARDDYPVIPFGNSDKIREGDWAIAIGSPFGLNRSVSFGIVSAKGRVQMGIVDIEDFIQTDAAINPGSSGGPLLNSRGELIGVNTAIFSQGGGNMGIGFAVPSRIAREISDELLAHGRISRGWVGMTAQDVDADLAKYFKLPQAQGALVSEVLPHGPAGKGTLKSGDVITRFDQHPISGAGELKALVGRSKAGSSVTVEILRDGKPDTLYLGIQEQPGPLRAKRTQLAGHAGGKLEKPLPSFGLAVEDVPRDVSKFLRLPERSGTLVVGVNPGSQAFESGIGPGDIILSIDRKPVSSAQAFNRLASQAQKDKPAESGEVTVLYVQRGPMERVFVPLKPGVPKT